MNQVTQILERKEDGINSEGRVFKLIDIIQLQINIVDFLSILRKKLKKWLSLKGLKKDEVYYRR